MIDIPAIPRPGWAQPLLAWGWQVMLHSAVATAAFALWWRRLRLPSGRSRRLMLVVILVLPLFTAAVPGRGGDAFRNGWALLDSSRLLALPLPWPLGGVHLVHLALLVAAVTSVAALWQEITPALHRAPRHGGAAPPELVRRARRLPGWETVRVEVSAVDHVCLATWGRPGVRGPGRPGITVSRGALEQLTGRQLDAALAHENAHWHDGRWWLTHALFAVRIVQIFNPVALWSFREYVVETEIACDRQAVAGGSAKPLASTLLAIYDDLDRGDVAGRSLLRRRVDVLLGRLPVSDGRPPAVVVARAAALLALVLPWIV